MEMFLTTRDQSFVSCCGTSEPERLREGGTIVFAKESKTAPIPSRQPSIRMGIDCDFEVMDAYTEFEFLLDEPLRLGGCSYGWVAGPSRLVAGNFCVIKNGYYSGMINLPEEKRGHDICCYCGADNGRHGELRNGFDCYNCQSN